MTTVAATSRFVPAELNPGEWTQLEPLYQSLADRAIDTIDDLRAWLADYGALDEVVDEYGSRRYIENTCHTDDDAIEKAYLHWVEHIVPKLKPWDDRMRRKFLEAADRVKLTEPPFGLMARQWRAEVELYRDENVPLQTEDTKLGSQYDKICGAMTVEFRGKRLTMQQLGKYLEQTERETRREAWDLSVQRRLADRDKLDDIFDEMVKLRHRIAINAGKSDFRAFMWQAKKRFDYTPADCDAFADSVAATVTPLVAELHRQRAADMGLTTLRPWDTAVDPKGRPPLRPFDETDIPGFVAKSREMFRRVASSLADDFGVMKLGDNLDLDSRPGKAPGGYQSSLELSRKPFIFMNSTGQQRDVETMLHEGGHAFHFIASSRKVPLIFVRHAPLEFCEVASMAMELLAADAYDVFYDEADAARAKRKALEGSVVSLPWMAVIDQFQHWIYTHPDHTRDERTAHWLSLMNRLMSPEIDWTGYDDYQAARWQAQLHLYRVPFYYIEYGIAQLGALQMWMNYRRDPKAAVDAYRSALSLGGTRPLPELFKAAGIRFDFTRATIEPLVTAVREELARLPE